LAQNLIKEKKRREHIAISEMALRVKKLNEVRIDIVMQVGVVIDSIHNKSFTLATNVLI
jgi:hypothetical protein